MVTNINHQELLDLRNKVVDNMLDNFDSWDGKVETGIKIIEDNKLQIEKIETLNLQLSRYPLAHSEEYVNKIKLVIQEQKKHDDVIKKEKEALLENMQQLNKKEQVIKSYISMNKKSIFIDKDVK